MNRRLAFIMILIIVLVKNSDAMLEVHGVASGSIYIRADGRVDPQTAPISNVDNVTYTFASDVNGSIVVQRSNIVIDGNGFALEGPGSGTGFYLDSISNVVIKKTTIRGFDFNGIYFHRTTNNTVCENIIKTNKGHGFALDYSLNNTIVGNLIAMNNGSGINLRWSCYNKISGNNITNNYDSLYFDESHSNTIIGNIIAKSNHYGIFSYLSSGNTFAGNIVEKGNYGIYLRLSSGTSIAENRITNSNNDGIYLFKSFSNTMIRNNISTNIDDGIDLSDSSENKIYRNEISSNNDSGISLSTSSNNIISGNTLLDNDDCFHLYESLNNSIYHNNFIDNTHQLYNYASANIWDNGVEGNFWSGDSVDLNRDGIGDLPQILDANNQDNYPLMGIFHSFNTSSGYYVDVVSSSKIEDFEYFKANNTIKMHVSNITASQTFGFCRVCIPMNLMFPPYTVIIDGGLTEVLHFNETTYVNSTHRWIYFAYEQSTHEVVIIPHYSNYYLLIIVVTLFITVTLLTVIVYRRKHTM